MVPQEVRPKLFPILEELNRREKNNLSPYATCSVLGIRRYPEKKKGYRQQFALDADRILHSRAYMRYIDKTQVFYLVDNDHITHRVLHVQLVARIARTIGRFLNLNEDLTSPSWQRIPSSTCRVRFHPFPLRSNLSRKRTD